MMRVRPRQYGLGIAQAVPFLGPGSDRPPIPPVDCRPGWSKDSAEFRIACPADRVAVDANGCVHCCPFGRKSACASDEILLDRDGFGCARCCPTNAATVPCPDARALVTAANGCVTCNCFPAGPATPSCPAGTMQVVSAGRVCCLTCSEGFVTPDRMGKCDGTVETDAYGCVRCTLTSVPPPGPGPGAPPPGPPGPTQAGALMKGAIAIGIIALVLGAVAKGTAAQGARS